MDRKMNTANRILRVVLVLATFVLIACLLGNQRRITRGLDALERHDAVPSTTLAVAQASVTNAASRKAGAEATPSARPLPSQHSAKEHGRAQPDPISLRLVQRIESLERNVELLLKVVDEMAQERSELIKRLPPPSPHDLAAAKGRSWGPEQAVGPPDTYGAGDIVTAWAPREQDGGAEWLRLDYGTPIAIAEVRVRETYYPGAIARVTAVQSDGSESLIWEGTYHATTPSAETMFDVQGSIETATVILYLDTTRVPGWNEIDAVALVGRDGTIHWATNAVASSTYADRSGNEPTPREERGAEQGSGGFTLRR
jgi:hypothetical protein